MTSACPESIYARLALGKSLLSYKHWRQQMGQGTNTKHMFKYFYAACHCPRALSPYLQI
jgi:hypothetical protein